MAWIGIDDLVDIYLRALMDPGLEGPVNATAPDPVRNSEFTRVLAGVLHRPAFVPVPAMGPRLVLGREGAAEVALASQRVHPAKLTGAGHRFRHLTLDSALRHVMGGLTRYDCGLEVPRMQWSSREVRQTGASRSRR